MGTFTHLQAYFTGAGLDAVFAASILGITSAFLMVGKVIWARCATRSARARRSSSR